MLINGLLLPEIKKIKNNISSYIINTPLLRNADFLSKKLNTNLFLKLEFLQHGGSFKLRGALNNIFHLNKEEKKRGVIAVSAGNHAIAVSIASKLFNINCKVIMLKSSNIFRIQKAKLHKSEVLLANNPAEAFQLIQSLSKKDGRIIIHPFEGLRTIQGSATLGYEIIKEIDDIDNIIISVGGGGLISGVGSIIRQKFPKCKIIGVEPEGACGLTQSLEKGKPLSNVKYNTIADSLSPPFHLPESFSICQNIINQMVLVSDLQMKIALRFMAQKYKFILEPAAVATIAALQGPLKNKLQNQKTIIILCGTNIDMDTWVNFYK